MTVIKKLLVLLCTLSGLNAAELAPSDLTIEGLRKMPNATLQSEDIINLLAKSSIYNNGRVWKLFGTSFSGDIGRIAEATEISARDVEGFGWLFYVTTRGEQKILVLHKLFRSYMEDDDLLIFTPVSDDFADNPWVRATTIPQLKDIGEGPSSELIKLFEPFFNRK